MMAEVISSTINDQLHSETATGDFRRKARSPVADRVTAYRPAASIYCAHKTTLDSLDVRNECLSPIGT